MIFPIEIYLIDSKQTKIIHSPREIPSGEPFRVLKTQVKIENVQILEQE
jgi:hypothetical protein